MLAQYFVPGRRLDVKEDGPIDLIRAEGLPRSPFGVRVRIVDRHSYPLFCRRCHGYIESLDAGQAAMKDATNGCFGLDAP